MSDPIDPKYLKEFHCNPGISKEKLLELQLPKNLPVDYLRLLEAFNGGVGEVGEECVVLYRAEELKEDNSGYGVQEFDPDMFLIGSNGGGEAIMLDLREEQAKVVLVPFIFEHEAIIELGNSMSDFFKRVYEVGYFEEDYGHLI